MDEYLILAFLNEIPQEIRLETLPLHLTLIRPFRTSKDVDYFISKLKYLTEGKNKMILLGKSEEIFGQQLETPVTELESTKEIQQMHMELLEAFKDSIEFKLTQYPHYRPHVSHDGEKKVSVGEKVVIDSVSLVKINSDAREIVASFKLS